MIFGRWRSLASVHGLGPWGRGFESHSPDQLLLIHFATRVLRKNIEKYLFNYDNYAPVAQLDRASAF